MIFKSFNNIVCQSAKVARVPWANRLDLIRKVDCSMWIEIIEIIKNYKNTKTNNINIKIH